MDQNRLVYMSNRIHEICALLLPKSNHLFQVSNLKLKESENWFWMAKIKMISIYQLDSIIKRMHLNFIFNSLKEII